MTIQGRNAKLGEKNAPWVRVIESLLKQILATLTTMQKDIAYLKQRVK